MSPQATLFPILKRPLKKDTGQKIPVAKLYTLKLRISYIPSTKVHKMNMKSMYRKDINSVR